MSNQDTARTTDTIIRDGARGPYSTVIRVGDIVYLSGQGGFLPDGERAIGGIIPETHATLDNVSELLGRAGASLRDLTQVTCYLVDIEELVDFNSAWDDYFGDSPRPTRTTIAAAALPFGLRLEMTCTAHIRADASHGGASI